MLNPFDGAIKVRFPNGTECWEKETITHGGSESIPSYQYGEDTELQELDYYGRVVDLEIWDEGIRTWTLVVNYFPFTSDAVSQIRQTIQDGWAKHSELMLPTEPHEGDTVERMLGAKGYLKIFDDVMDTVMRYKVRP